MPIDLRETRLPGIGVKYGFRLDAGGRISLILHNDGKRELYWFRRAHDEDPTAVITLDDDEARQLGALLGGAYERPKIVEDLEMALGELQIEWVAVPDTSPGSARRSPRLSFVRRTASRSSPSCASLSRSRGAAAGRDPARRHAGHRGKAGQYPAFYKRLERGEEAEPA